MAKTLNMRFLLDNGKTTTMGLAQPKDNLTRAQVEPVMQAVLDASAISVNGALAVAMKSAAIREVTATKLI